MSGLGEAEIQTIRALLTSYYGSGDLAAAASLFEIIDVDKSGSLEASEIAPVISALTGKQVEAAVIEEIIQAADSDGNSTIEPNEFPALLNEEAVRKLLHF